MPVRPPPGDVLRRVMRAEERLLRADRCSARFYNIERGSRRYKGWLLLTNDRLVFSPDPEDPPGRRYDAALGHMPRPSLVRSAFMGMRIGAHAIQVVFDTTPPNEFRVPDARSWLTDIHTAQHNAGPPADLEDQLHALRRGASPPDRAAVLPLLLRERGFPGGFWHPEDHAAMADVVLDTARHLRLEGVSDAIAAAAAVPLEGADLQPLDEDTLLEHQQRALASTLNQALATRGANRRLRRHDLRDPDAGWVLLSDEEWDLLVASDVIRPNAG